MRSTVSTPGSPKGKLLVLTLSALDNDSRILKETQDAIDFGFEVECVSVNSKKQFEFPSVVVQHKSTRVLGIPGLAAIILHFKFLLTVLGLRQNAKAVHCNDLETLHFGAALKIASLGSIKILYDAHEFESNCKPNQSRFSVGIRSLIEGMLLKFVDGTVTVSSSIAKEYASKYGIPTPAVVHNAPYFTNHQRKNLYRDRLGIRPDQSIFLYQGALSAGRGIDYLLSVFSSYQSDDKVVVFMGYGALEKRVLQAAGESDNIYFHPAVDPSDILDYTSSADFGISFIEDVSLSYRYSLPNKFFEYLMAGIPVICANLPDMKALVNEHSVGVAMAENSEKGLKAAIDRATKLDMRSVQINVDEFKKIYCWENEAVILKSAYNDLFIA